jgi:propanol-preferring alcohol dehydrogenase
MPEFDYDSLLWGERQIRSVANMTRQDARDFLSIAEKIKLTPQVRTFSLEQANEALLSLHNDELNGSAVLVP